MNIEEYTNALKSHDWFYDFCDAYSSPRWSNGHKRHIQLERAAMDLDPDHKIWNEHAPDMYKKDRGA